MHTYEEMVARIDATPELEPYRNLLTYDWAEAEEHYNWACTATVEEIANWAQVVEAEASDGNDGTYEDELFA